MATRRRMLLAVAARLFLQHGYHGVSLAAIAREAHVALRTIYLGFGDKRGLLAAVQAQSGEAFASHYDLLDPAGALHATLLGFALAYVRFIEENRALHVDGPQSAGVTARSGTVLETTRSRLRGYFEAPAVRAQLRSDVEPALVASHFIACISGEPGGHADLPARLVLFLRAVTCTAPND